MYKCVDCQNYVDENSFKGTGWCQIWEDFMKGEEDYSCDSWEEKDEE